MWRIGILMMLAVPAVQGCSINTRVGPVMNEPVPAKPLQEQIPERSASKIFVVTDRNILGAYTLEILFNADAFHIDSIHLGDMNSFSGEPKFLRKDFVSGKIRISAYVSELDRHDPAELTKYHVATIYWVKAIHQAARMKVGASIIDLYDTRGRRIDGVVNLYPDEIQAPMTEPR